MENQHPNIVRCILHTLKGIFLHQMKSTLQGRLESQTAPIPAIAQERWVHWPWPDVAPPARIQKLIRGELPSTSADQLFGGMTTRCWHGEYASVADVQQDVLSRLGRSVAEEGCEKNRG
ncbi:uncharacterized protein THITE_2107527 [Thermothielavioides terrestris NRRL 8126]|uniref:Uncharacterized protein n=1 Tax=Thermothielavioides terrestris (strain ATCC 38088 / NRRL 8126) TaxID=578455 RepID=G2QU82_THETT|nr:uncharacterized protein THITE_2107527 [Thermothielavioides terrestris NRRL 8126]AEO62834.1 hypothetical protein THITE_2107527 [Thermothielavioides terrestris NRRL 8126]